MRPRRHRPACAFRRMPWWSGYWQSWVRRAQNRDRHGRAVAAATGVLLSQQLLRDRLQLHVGRPLVNCPYLRVAIELLDGVVLRVAIPTEQLDAERRHALAHL